MVGGDVAAAALYYGGLDGSLSVAQFLCSPAVGVLCDRHGRKRLLLLSLLGTAFYCVAAMAALHLHTLSFPLAYALLLAGAVASGATAGEKIVYFAIVSDVSKAEQRPRLFGILGASMGVGLLCGAVVGFLTSLAGLSLFFTLLLTASLFLADAVLVLALLHETLAPHLRLSRIPWAKANPWGSVRFYASPSHGSRSSYILALVPALFMTLVLVSLLLSVFLYFSAAQYGWGTPQVYLFMLVSGVLVAGVQLSSPLVFKRWPAPKVLLVALSCRCVSDPLLAFSTLGWQAFLFVPFFAVSSLASTFLSLALSPSPPSLSLHLSISLHIF